MSDTPAGRILIIGASGGIGSALTRRLASRGYSLLLAARGQERLDELASECGAKASVVDATSFDAVKGVVSSSGEIDGVVNLCGSIFLKPAHLTSELEYEATIAQNLTTAFATVHASVGALRKRGGSIVLMSSAAASVGLTGHEAIAAAKAGVEGLVRAAAASYAGNGIRVNAIAPGLVDTPLSASITSNDSARKASESMHPLQRIGRADEIASIIEWLLGADATWVTGQIIGVDGGLSRVRGRASSG